MSCPSPARARDIADHGEKPRLERGCTIKPRAALDDREVSHLQDVLRIGAIAARTGERPRKALFVQLLELARVDQRVMSQSQARLASARTCLVAPAEELYDRTGADPMSISPPLVRLWFVRRMK